MLLHTFICKNCGKEYQTKYKNRNQFCSKDCAYAYHHEQKVERDKYKAAYQPEKKVHKSVCPKCGKAFESQKADKIYCSDECAYEVLKERSRKRSEKVARSKSRPTCVCKECGKHFTPEYGNKHREFCSDKCKERHHNHLYEIMRRGKPFGLEQIDEDISLEKLIKRDNGICYLCGQHVDCSANFNDDNAPSIDHVVPLARGGAHTWDNVKLAHRGCNAKKGDSLLKAVG